MSKTKLMDTKMAIKASNETTTQAASGIHITTNAP